jgi:hypothetical protein
LTSGPAEALAYDVGFFVWIADIAYWIDRRMNRKIRQAREAKQPTPYPKSRYASDHWWDDGCDTFDQLHP